MQVLLNPTYFPPITHMVVAKNYEVVFEVYDFYDKQTYRNRMYIYGANGKQMLTVPIIHSLNQKKQHLKDIKVDNSVNWKKQHWKTLETAYRSSAYFEYYESKLKAVFAKDWKFLVDLNVETFDVICSCTNIVNTKTFTKGYTKTPYDSRDFRHLSNAKSKQNLNFEPYYQLFSDKHGFLENLSTLDLICNEGPQAKTYIAKCEIE